MTECTRINETNCVSHSRILSLSHGRYIEPICEAADRVHAYGASSCETSKKLQILTEDGTTGGSMHIQNK